MKRRLPSHLAILFAGLFVVGATSSGAWGQEGAQRCGALPPPVEERRAAILAAAEGDLDGLAALADTTDFTSNYGGEETLAYWQYLQGEGQDIRETAKALLALGCTVEPDDDRVYYTWPAAVGLAFSDLTEEERTAIGTLNGGDIESLYVEGTEAGYYVGWTLVITSDGRWIALVAGD